MRAVEFVASFVFVAVVLVVFVAVMLTQRDGGRDSPDAYVSGDADRNALHRLVICRAYQRRDECDRVDSALRNAE